MTTLNKSQIIELLPHREPMLLIDELYDIKKLHSATAIMNVKKDSFYSDRNIMKNMNRKTNISYHWNSLN